MDFKLALKEVKTPEDVAKLISAISELADSLDVLYSEVAPDGNISGRVGQICLYNNAGVYTQWQNVDGETTWQQMATSSDLASDVADLTAAILWEVDGGDTEMKTADDMDMQNMQIKGMCIENRTNDTGCTQTGRIWFRTDL